MHTDIPELEQLESGLLSWSRCKENQIVVHGYGVCDCQDVLAKLTRAQAFANSPHALVVVHHDNATLEALQRLSEQGLAHCTEQSHDVSRWTLSDKAMQAFDFAQMLRRPLSCFKPRSNLELVDSTPWELFLALQSNGWDMKRAPSKKDQLALQPYVVGEDKLWYRKSVSCKDPRSYMRCLVAADTLLENFGVRQIPHFQGDGYYKKLEKGKVDGIITVQAIEDIVADNSGMLPLEWDVEQWRLAMLRVIFVCSNNKQQQ